MRLTSTIAALLAGCTAIITAGCGTSSSGTPPRAVETLMYVQGRQNLQFAFADIPDPSCGSMGTGIEGPRSSHQFGSRVFLAPHLFVLENTRQPIRAVIRNLDPVDSLTVDLFLGTVQRISNVVIPPGECQTIFTGNPGVSPDSLVVDPVGPAVQVDVCSPLDQNGTPDIQLDCVTGAADPPDRNLGFFASLGDIAATNITNCSLINLLDTCRTPATFFIERPIDRVDAVMQVNAGQNPGGLPPQIRAELAVNGQRVETDAGGNPIVSHQF